MSAPDGNDNRGRRPSAPGSGQRTRPPGRPPEHSIAAQKVQVSGPGRLPPAARVHPLLTLFVSEDERTDAVPELRALFELLDKVGAAEVYQRTAARTSWWLLGTGNPHVALRLEISEPTDARGVVEVLINVEDYRRAWDSIRDAHWVGITTSDRLRPHADGSAAGLDEVFAACIPIMSSPPPAPLELTHAAR
jgi:hypothetical protein